MVINRRPSRYPRRGGPSCLTILLFILGTAVVGFLTANASDIRDAIVPTPTPEPTRTAASYAISASLYQNDGDYERAIASYENAITLNPENWHYYTDLIRLLTFASDPEGAIYWAERAILLEPDKPEVLTSVAAAYLLNGQRLAEVGERAEADLQYQQAIDTARRAVQVDPNNAEAYAYLAGALIYQDRENFAEAQEMADTALAIAPKNAVVRFYRGVVLETQGYYQLAIEQYELARDEDPNYLEPALALAYSYFYTENRARAINVLRDLIENNPTNADAHDALGWMLFLAGQYPEAEVYLEDAVELDPSLVRAQAHLGAAYYKNFNYEMAIPRLEDAVLAYEDSFANGVNLNDSSALYYNYLGFAYYYLDSSLCNQRADEYVFTANQVFQRVVESMGEDSFRGQDALFGMDECRQATLGGG